jgi:hypothetical protein
MNRPSDLALLAWQIEALYRVDSAGRLLAVNEPGPEAEQPPAPRFFLGRTTQGNLWRFRHDLPADLTAALDERCRQEPVTADLTQPPQQAEAIRTLLHDHAPIASEYQGPAFWIPEATTHAAPATVIRLARENQHLLATTLPELLSWSWLQVRSPALATVVDGQAVAICFCARLTDHVAEAGVETAPACPSTAPGGPITPPRPWRANWAWRCMGRIGRSTDKQNLPIWANLCFSRRLAQIGRFSKYSVSSTASTVAPSDRACAPPASPRCSRPRGAGWKER